MSQSSLRVAFSAATPLQRAQNSTTSFQICRACRARLLTHPSPSQRSTFQQSHDRSGSTPSLSARTARRQFSTTSVRPATAVLQNSRTDDEGNPMTINISERAATRLRQITSSPPSRNTLNSKPTSQGDSHLRVTVTSGGCHGFQYLMALEDASKIDTAEDTIFEYELPETEVNATEGKAEVVMDSASLELLKGSTIDFTQELIGSQFKVVGNPRATSSCGCGTSFDIE